MLFDETLASPHVSRAFGMRFESFRRDMMRAERFDLSPQFAAAVDSIANDNPEAFTRAKNLIRPPYPTTWWEVAAGFRVRHRLSEKSAVANGNGYETHRVGVLMQQTSSLDQAFVMHLFYSRRERGATLVSASLLSMVADFRDGVPVIRTNDGAETIGLIPNPYLSGIFREAVKEQRNIRSTINGDWAGEPQFWATVLMLLNSRNLAYSESLPADKRHRRLREAGLAPPTTFRVCKLDMSRLARGGSGSSDGIASVRAHFVRGHFKVRKSGVYWWRPFVRGDVGNGFAKKHYELVGTQS